jgi:hypothetical protein
MKKITHSLYLLILCSLLSLAAVAQTDTEFWFAAPEVSVNSANFDRPIVFRLTAYNQASTIIISQPANLGFTPITVNLAANATNSVDLTPWIDQIENKPADAILNYGLLITATTPITAYYEVVSQQCLCNPEIFALKGRNALGTNFFIPAQNFTDNNTGYNPVPYSSFDIIATDDNTVVTITPSNGGGWSCSRCGIQHHLKSRTNLFRHCCVTSRSLTLNGLYSHRYKTNCHYLKG